LINGKILFQNKRHKYPNLNYQTNGKTMKAWISRYDRHYGIALLILWSWLVNCSLGDYLKPMYVLVNLFITLLIFKLPTIISRSFLLLVSLFSAFMFPITATFGKPSINMVTAMIYANHEEITTTIKNIHPTLLIPGAIILSLCALIIKRIKNPITIGNKKICIMLVFIAITVFAYPLFIYNERDYIYAIKYPPIQSVIKAIDSFNLVKKTNLMIAKEKTMASDFSKENTANKKYDTYIMVIGESVRRDYMNLYGAPFKNTPFLSSSPGLFFDNYVSSAFSTIPSLTHSLLRVTSTGFDYNDSIIRLAENSGLKTYWLSNQGLYSFYDSPIATVGMQADYHYFTKIGDSHFKEYIPDTILLPEIKKALSSTDKKLIVIHLTGSHMDFCKRVNYHSNFKLYDRQYSCYAQSIFNTDQLLQTIVNTASSDNDRWSMLYFSDHGLSHTPLTGDLSYSDTKRQNYSPPFVIINYDDNSIKHITAFRSGLEFEKIFAQWIGVNEPLLRSNCHFFTNSECNKNPMVYNKNMKLQSFLSLPNDPARY